MSDPDDQRRIPGDAPKETMEPASYEDEEMRRVHTQLMREKEEPSEGFSPIPIFLLFVFGALMFWGGIYVTKYSGNFRDDVYDYTWTPTAGGAATEVAFDPMARGGTLYERNCQTCHQGDGEGVSGVYPPLNKSEWVTNDPERFAAILLYGLAGPIEVRGNVYNAAAMPSYGPNGAGWSDRDIAAVMTYVRASWENSDPAVEESTVADVRSQVSGRLGAWSAEELLEIWPWDSGGTGEGEEAPEAAADGEGGEGEPADGTEGDGGAEAAEAASGGELGGTA